MTTGELIKLLQSVDQSTPIYLSNTDPTGYTVKLELNINDVELNGDLISDSEIDNVDRDWEMFDGVGDYIGPKVVVFNLDY